MLAKSTYKMPSAVAADTPAAPVDAITAFEANFLQ
jgi:hypothetical protein